MSKMASKTQTVTLRVTPAELELLRAASETLGWSIGEVMLSSALALGADVETRWMERCRNGYCERTRR